MLTNKEIGHQISNGVIQINDHIERYLSKPNSVRVRITDTVYKVKDGVYNLAELDLLNEIKTGNLKHLTAIDIPEKGLELEEKKLYITTSQEEIISKGYVPVLYGKTLLSTLGLSIETNNTYLYDNFSGKIPITLIPNKNIVIYPKMEIGNLVFHKSVDYSNSTYGMLSGKEILKKMDDGSIVINSLKYAKINPNSVNLSLNPVVEVYTDKVLDVKGKNKKSQIILPEEGAFLDPNECYVARTNEWTETYDTVPTINGRSSGGRLGVFVACSAGLGSVGYKGYWHLGPRVIKNLKVYPNMQICQIAYYTLDGNISNYYDGYLQSIPGHVDVQYSDTLKGKDHKEYIKGLRCEKI